MSFFQDVKVEMRGWIAECLADVEQEGGCSIIGLLHKDGSGRENTIWRTSIVPPWARTISRTMNRPSPSPRGLPPSLSAPC